MAPAAQVRWIEIDGETLVLELDTGVLHLLDRPAAAIWRRLDGVTSDAEIVRGLVDEFAADPARVERDFATLVATLRERGLVQRGDAGG